MPTTLRKMRIERPDPAVVEILRTKSTVERLQMAFASNRFVRERLRAHLRYAHPDWSDQTIAAEIARRMLWNNPTSSDSP